MMLVPRTIRKRKRLPLSLLVIAVLFLAYLFAPQVVDALGPPADPHQSSCEKINVPGDPDLVPRPNPGAVKIIRLTNDGEFVDRCEFTDALYELNWDVPKSYGPATKVGAANLPRLTLLYVHGWKHGASSTDSDLIAFTKLVQTLQKHHEGKKQLLGIYVSWNASNGLGLLDNLSFWSKKSIADRVSQSGVVTRIVASIGSVRKVDGQRSDQFIAIGHSFGARMVFSATNQPLVAEASRSHPGNPSGEFKIIPGSADAVILLNPAFEASLYTTLDTFCSRAKETFPEKQAPLLISVATDADEATGMFFPLGQWIGMSRSKRNKTTLGNFEPYQTHSLFETARAQCVKNGETTLTEYFSAEGLCLTRLARQPACTHNPFLVVGTDKQVIADHNDIWNDKFSRWLFAFITELEASHQGFREHQDAKASSK
jgi:hypothetical protein